MQKLLLVVGCSLVAAASVLPGVSAHAFESHWWIGDAALSPRGVPANGQASYVLYFYCAAGGGAGFSAAEFDLTASGGMTILGFTPMNGFVNAGTASNLLLAYAGCSPQGTIAGMITVLDFGGQLCLGPSSQSGQMIAVDCMSPTLTVPVRYRGFSTDGGAPCRNHPPYGWCGTLSVEATSWGGVKTLYR